MGLRLAVIGCGAWGINHVRSATQLADAELAVVCDLAPAARDRARPVAPMARAVATPEQVFADPSIDAVIIAAPAPVHARLAWAALEAGKHVLVEKPFVLDARDGPPLVALAAERGRTLMVGHLLRYHPYFRRLRALVQEGELGRVHYLYSERVNHGRARADQDVLWSLAPHDVSMMCALIAAPVVEVSATGQALLPEGGRDVAFATLRFADDTLAHLHVSWLHPEKRRRLTVVGARKMAVLDDVEPTQKLRIHDQRPGAAVDPLRAGDIFVPVVPMIEPLVAEQQHFVDCIRAGRTPETDGHEALAVSRCLVAAQQSMEAGGMPVRLPETQETMR